MLSSLNEERITDKCCSKTLLCKCLRPMRSFDEESEAHPIRTEHVYCDLSGLSNFKGDMIMMNDFGIMTGIDQYLSSNNNSNNNSDTENSQLKSSLTNSNRPPPIPSHRCNRHESTNQNGSCLQSNEASKHIYHILNNKNRNTNPSEEKKEDYSEIASESNEDADTDQNVQINHILKEIISNYSENFKSDSNNLKDLSISHNLNNQELEDSVDVPLIENYLSLIENHCPRGTNNYENEPSSEPNLNHSPMLKKQEYSSDLKLDQVLEELNDLNRTVKKYQTMNSELSQVKRSSSARRNHCSQSHGDLRHSFINDDNDVHFGTNSNSREHYLYQEFVDPPEMGDMYRDRVLDLTLGGSCNSIIKFDKPMPVFSPKVIHQATIRENTEPKLNLRRSPSPPLIEPRPPVRIPYPEMPRPPTPPNIDTRPVGAVHWCRGEKGGCAGVESCQLRTAKEVHLPPPLPIPESQEAHKKLLRENKVPSQIDPTLPTEAWLPEDEEARRRYKLAQQQRNEYTYRMRDYQTKLEEYQNKLIERRKILQANDEAEMKYQIERQKYLERLNKKRSQSTGRIITHGTVSKSPNIYRTTLFTSQSLRCSAKQLESISAENSPNLCRKATYINPSGLNHPLAKSEGNRLYVKPPRVYPEERFEKECIGLEPIGPGVHHLESGSSQQSPRIRGETVIDESNIMPLQHQAEPIRTVEGAFERGLRPTPVEFDQLLNSVRHTSPQWYKPNMSRDEVIQKLANLPAGSFVVRESSTFQNSFGLALKVTRLPHHIKIDPNSDLKNQLVRHFLIDRISGGFRIRGYESELIFATLSELVAYHCRKTGALPCTLKLPGYAPAPTQADLSQTGLEKEILRDTTTIRKHRSRSNTPHRGSRKSNKQDSNNFSSAERRRTHKGVTLAVAEGSNEVIDDSFPLQCSINDESNTTFRQLLPKGAACIMYYLSSSDINQLTGAIGLKTGIDKIMGPNPKSINFRPIEVNFNVIADGIVMTDIHRRCFFRRHYPLQNLLYFNIDPQKREFTMTVNNKTHKLKILGFISRVSDSSLDNRCHILSECERGESAKVISQFINKYLISSK